MDITKLDALEGLVTEVDGEGPPTPEQTKQAQAEQQLEEGARNWGMIAFTIGGGLAMFAPELKQVYSEDACMQWGQSMMPAAEKYGWNNPSSMPELGLLITTMGLGVPTVLVIREKLRLVKEEKAALDAAAKRSTPADGV